MSEVDAMLKRYAEVRERLRNPPNAVPDTGINLRRHREPSSPTHIPVPEPLPPPQPHVISSLPPEPPKHLTLRSTFEISSGVLGLAPHELTEKRITRDRIFLRQIAIYVATKQKRWPITWISRLVNMDHSTIYYSYSKIERLLETDEHLKATIEDIERKLGLLPSPAASSDHQPYLGQGEEGNVPEPILSQVD